MYRYAFIYFKFYDKWLHWLWIVVHQQWRHENPKKSYKPYCWNNKDQSNIVYHSDIFQNWKNMNIFTDIYSPIVLQNKDSPFWTVSTVGKERHWTWPQVWQLRSKWSLGKQCFFCFCFFGLGGGGLLIFKKNNGINLAGYVNVILPFLQIR